MRKQNRNSQFQRGSGRFQCRGSGRFQCHVCKRQTRYTGTQSLGTDLCPQCFDLAGIENAISDYGDEAIAEYRSAARLALAELRQRGGDLAGWADLIARIAEPEEPAHAAGCPCPECFGGPDDGPADPRELAEDYPGQRITGPDHDTRDREGFEDLAALASVDADASVAKMLDRMRAPQPARIQRVGAVDAKGQPLAVHIVAAPAGRGAVNVYVYDARGTRRRFMFAIDGAQLHAAVAGVGFGVADIQRGDDPREDHRKIEAARARKRGAR